MKLNKIAALFVAAALSVGTLTACGDKDGKTESRNDTNSAETSAESKAEEDDTAEGTPVSETHQNDKMTPTSAVDLVAQMTNGWNLGNTMDASGNGLDAETAWLPT
ncbi:hypothetical protein [uncultured Ruminococcus sp.]|uniref:hypothetical protein n=1 Tax=uncultured Ruminococcus sp. TaxID=165186 RepID=UPI0025FF57A9|nr:hypothetical protein [uncultured Ruminococcus sp.]